MKNLNTYLLALMLSFMLSFTVDCRTSLKSKINKVYRMLAISGLEDEYTPSQYAKNLINPHLKVDSLSVKVNLVRDTVSSVLDHLGFEEKEIIPITKAKVSQLMSSMELFADIVKGNKKSKDIAGLANIFPSLSIERMNKRVENKEKLQDAVDFLKDTIYNPPTKSKKSKRLAKAYDQEDVYDDTQTNDDTEDFRESYGYDYYDNKNSDDMKVPDEEEEIEGTELPSEQEEEDINQMIPFSNNQNEGDEEDESVHDENMNEESENDNEEEENQEEDQDVEEMTPDKLYSINDDKEENEINLDKDKQEYKRNLKNINNEEEEIKEDNEEEENRNTENVEEKEEEEEEKKEDEDEDNQNGSIEEQEDEQENEAYDQDNANEEDEENQEDDNKNQEDGEDDEDDEENLQENEDQEDDDDDDEDEDDDDEDQDENEDENDDKDKK